jgi:hypothetical protein
MKTTPGDDAFASHAVSDNEVHYGEDGLTKREYFAAHIMAGLAMRSDLHWDAKTRSSFAVECADALIDALNDSP